MTSGNAAGATPASAAVQLSGVFAHRDRLLEAIRRLKDGGFGALEVMMPIADEEILEAIGHRGSRLGMLTLAGGILGMVGGFWGAAWTHLRWDIFVGGKPIVSVPPFIIVAFEMLILFGATLNLIAVFLFCRLPKLKWHPHYDPRVPEDHYVLVVETQQTKVEAARAILADLAAEVKA